MAKASKETIIVKPAQEAITEDIITLQLSKEEATPDNNVAEKQEFKFKLGERVFILEWAEFGKIKALPIKGGTRYEVEVGEGYYYYFYEDELWNTSEWLGPTIKGS